MVRGLRSIGTLAEFWKVVRELNPQTIEQDATRNFRVIITGSLSDDVDWLFSLLTKGQPAIASVISKPLVPGDSSVDSLPVADLYVYVARPGVSLSRDEAGAIQRLDARGYPVLLVLCRADGVDSEDGAVLGSDLVVGTIPAHRMVVIERESVRDIEEKLLPAVLEVVPHLHLALARQVPLFRLLVSQQVIRETSRVNAEFAALSSVPANIPILGTLVATGADLVVLTKNQVMMLLKLAAIHDRDLSAKLSLAAEIAPVVGGAFMWRSLARTLVDLLPGSVSFVPKTLIAAVGTYVVGSIALHYYQVGTRPDSLTMAQLRSDGLQGALKLLTQIRGR